MNETKLINFEFRGVRFIAESRTKITINRSEEIVFKMESKDSTPISSDELTKIREDLIVYKANFTTLLAFYYGNGLFEFDFDHFYQNKLMITKMILESDCEEDLGIICDDLKNDFIRNSHICDVLDYFKDTENFGLKCDRLYIYTNSIVYNDKSVNDSISEISVQDAKISIPDYSIVDANMKIISVKCDRNYDENEVISSIVYNINISGPTKIADGDCKVFILNPILSVMHLSYFRTSGSELLFVIIFRPDNYLLISDENNKPLLLTRIFIDGDNSISLCGSGNLIKFGTHLELVDIFDSKFDIHEQGCLFIYEIIKYVMLSIPNFIMTCYKNDFWVYIDQNDGNDVCMSIDSGIPTFILIPVVFDPDSINETEDQISVTAFFKPIVINPIPENSTYLEIADDCAVSFKRVLTSKRFSDLTNNINKRFFTDIDLINPPIFIHNPNDNSSETDIMHFLQMSQKGNIRFFYIAPGRRLINYDLINELSENGYLHFNLRDQGDLIIKPDDWNKLIDIPI